MIVRARALEADPALAGFALAFGRLTLAKVADWIVHGAAPCSKSSTKPILSRQKPPSIYRRVKIS